MIKRRTLGVLISSLLAVSAAADDRVHGSCNPRGTWFVNVSFPAINLHFQQLLTLHRGGTLTATNNVLHPNSIPDPNAVPMPSPPAPPPFNGSHAHGSWKLLPGCRVQWSYRKFVFAGYPTPLPDGTMLPAGIPVGYRRVTSTAHISGETNLTLPGATVTELVFGTGPLTADGSQVQRFPDSAGTGFRWRPFD